MINIEKNALRIAELLEYDKWRLDNIQDVLICRYTAYDYLMPIVFECTNSCYNYVVSDLSIFDYDTEHEFIEAIQLVIIKYLELKNV